MGRSERLEDCLRSEWSVLVRRFGASGLLGYVFFQAEDGIRDVAVTGVQTCALPIWIRLARQTNPGASTLSNADSRLANWNANAIHSFTPAGGAWKATTALGVQWEDRALGRSRVIARGLLPGQKNINQGSVINVFEENTHERTIALY